MSADENTAAAPIVRQVHRLLLAAALARVIERAEGLIGAVDDAVAAQARAGVADEDPDIEATIAVVRSLFQKAIERQPGIAALLSSLDEE